MSQTLQDRYAGNGEDRPFAETPFLDQRLYESQEEPQREATAPGEVVGGPWEVTTPFLVGEATEAGEAETATPEVAALAELATTLKDAEFREALEQLADEALETHADQLAGEYGDREMRDAAAERLLADHFEPLAAQAETMLDRFFERLEGYEAETLTDPELDRVAGEVMPSGVSLSPASEQFLNGLINKAKKLASSAVGLAKRGIQGAVKFVGKGLAVAGKLVFGPLLKPLAALARFLLRYVVRFALNQVPPYLRPLAQKLSDRLFRAIGETHEGEGEDHEQTEAEVIPAAPDVARLEAEFDLEAAQLLLTPDEAEAEYLAASYGEAEPAARPLAELDQARAQFTSELQRLQPGESAQPAMEQFVPAIWAAAKTATAIVGRRKVVGFLGNLLGKLIAPMIGKEAAGLLAPAIADVGLRVFGLETSPAPTDPRAVATEALAATVEETVNSLSELPSHVFENETLLETAVHEAFEDAAAMYFPPTMIRPELRETTDGHGMWRRMPVESQRKRYAKHTESIPVTITPRVASTVHTFGGATLRDHLDRMGVPAGRTVKTSMRLYHALPGTRAAHIARAEGIRPHHLHPLTKDAAGALLGPAHAGLSPRHATPSAYLSSPHKLHLRQRLYYLEPPDGRPQAHHRHHARLARSEMLINLREGKIRIWLYLSETLCQRVSTELARTRNPAAALRHLKPLVHRAAAMLRTAILERHLPPELRLISEVPNLDARVPPWLVLVGRQLAAKVEEWASQQVAQYLRNNAEEFRRISATHHDGLTLSIAMSGIPGVETLRLVAQGKQPRAIQGAAWLRGTPAFVVHAYPGYAIR